MRLGRFAMGALTGGILASIATATWSEMRIREELIRRCGEEAGTYLLKADRMDRRLRFDCSSYRDGRYCHVVAFAGDNMIVPSEAMSLGFANEGVPLGDVWYQIRYHFYVTASISQIGPGLYKQSVNFGGPPPGIRGIIRSLLDPSAYVTCYTV